MNLNFLLNRGIERILKTAGRYYIKDREGRAFLARLLPRMTQSAAIRSRYEKNGIHIPSFLIASVASQCNLHCTGCYSRAGGFCDSTAARSDLAAADWEGIFKEAAELGISFILLAGGEPFMRYDIIKAAARSRDIVFPVFTNGTLLDEERLDLLDGSRNIIPVFSLEGEEGETDIRRGKGVYSQIRRAMNRLQQKGILFGVSITVTKENLDTVTKPSFLSDLRSLGCGLAVFVEYVPISEGTEYLALDRKDLETLACAASQLREQINDMIILSFPGDEEAMGGCLASGRGFFHINAAGGAEPCPFSPFAKQNLKDSSILEVLESDYFAGLRNIAVHAGAHTGGCTLFKQKDQVAALNMR